MKKFLLIIVLLTGCKYNPDKIRWGDRVLVTSGFYKGYKGKVVSEISWMLPCQHKFFVDFDGIYKREAISVCNLAKIKDIK